MSKISLSGNASGTGTLTIAAPNTNSNYTLDLPTASGTLASTGGQPSFASTIGVGAATPAASGAGITFPATQSASTDANTLDDYEEGTWSPTILGESSAGTTTYTNQGGRYTKIGNMVTVWCDVSYSAATGTGPLWIGSLPFASFNDSGNLRYPGACLTQNYNWSAGCSYLQVFCQAGNTTVNLLGASDDGNWVESVLSNESARISFTLTYRVS